MTNAIEKELAELDKRREQTLALDPVAVVAHAVSDAFPQFKFDVSITRWTAEPPFVNLCTHEVGAFPDLTPVFRDLASRGWHTDKAQPFDDFHEINRRTYNLCVPGEFKVTIDPVTGNPVPPTFRSSHRLRLMAFLKTEGATCRKVQVGTKEEPVYEFVCDDTPAAT